MSDLRDARMPLDHPSLPFPLRLAPKFGIERALVAPGAMFTVYSDHITVRGIGELPSRSPITYRAPGLKKTHLAFVEKPKGWSAYITMKRPSRKAAAKRKKRERFHHEAAIFVTDKAPAKTVSGGLPSLGKKR